MEHKFIQLIGDDVEVLVNNETVLFEKSEVLESEEYSDIWLMNGYVGDEIIYTASCEYERGSDEFVELHDVDLY